MVSNVHSFVYWKSQHNMKKLCNKDSEDSSSPPYGIPVKVVLVVFHCVPHLMQSQALIFVETAVGFGIVGLPTQKLWNNFCIQDQWECRLSNENYRLICLY